MVLGAASSLWGQVGIQPAFVELSLDKGRPSGRFLLSNRGEEVARYRVNAKHFTYTVEGGLQQTETGDHSLAPWVHFNPRELVIPPATQYAVRFVVVPRGTLADGEYWGAMELESLKTIEATSEDDAEGKALKLQLISAIMVPIFGTVGEVEYNGRIEDFGLVVKNHETHLEAVIVNTGTGRLGAKATYKIATADGEIIEEQMLDKGYVLRGLERRFSRKIEVPLPAGRYIISVIVDSAHLKAPLERERQVDWEPPAEPQSVTESANVRPTGPTELAGWLPALEKAAARLRGWFARAAERPPVAGESGGGGAEQAGESP